MEKFSYSTESGESSPHSRDLGSPRPGDDQNSNHNKVKFMCSYGGKILPRPHDNHLSYVGGQTKILAVDRFVKFASVIAMLTVLCEGDVFFKYQLPGEDLDALISVTNDDDLEHMMLEYDRLKKGKKNTSTSTSPTARLRLFLFRVTGESPALTAVNSCSSVDALNQHGARIEKENEVIINKSEHIQKHIHELQKLQMEQQQQQQQEIQQKQLVFSPRARDDNLAAAGYTGDYLVPKMHENVAPVSGYQISGGYTPCLVSVDQQQQQQPVYMVQAPASVYHAPMAAAGPVSHGQGYYVQMMPTSAEVYHEQQVYNVMPPVQAVSTQQTTVSAQQQFLPYTEGYRVVQSTTAVTDQGYGQVAHDNGVGRQIYYTTSTTQGAPAVVAQQQQPQQLIQPLQQTVVHQQPPQQLVQPLQPTVVQQQQPQQLVQPFQPTVVQQQPPQQLVQPLQPTVVQQYQAMAAAQENGTNVVA